MTTPTTPTTVEVGQMWRDRDQRSKGSGEFTVVAVVGSRYGDTNYLPGLGAVTARRISDAAHRVALRATTFPVAVVLRHETGRLTRIRNSRLLHGPYELIGKSR